MKRDRNYIYETTVYLYAAIASIGFIFWYISLGFYQLIYQQLFIVSVYLICYFLAKKRRKILALRISVLLVISFSILGCYQFGWDSGTQVYLILLISLIILSEKVGKREKIAYSVVISGIIIFLWIYMSENIPPYILPHPWKKLLREIHSVISFIIVTKSIFNYGQIVILNEKEWNSERITILNKAYTDSLTGIYNRRFVEGYLKGELFSKNINGKIIALLDIDNFKSINDNYGHKAGDIVIQELVSRLKHNLRDNDIVGRWGGEEFLMLIEENSLEKASVIIDRLRVAICSSKFKISEKDSINVTATIGFAMGSTECEWQDIILQADRYLYFGKKSGKNCICSKLTH